MKTKENNKQSPNFKKVRKLLGLPLRLQINFENFNVGTLLIDYQPSPFVKSSKGKLNRRRSAQVSAILEIVPSANFWKNDLELALKLSDKYMAGKHKLLNLVRSYDYENVMSRMTQGQLFYIFGDDIVLDFIRSEGPLALRVFAVNMVLHRWLDDPRVGAKLDKLNNALLKSWTGKQKGEIRFADGRPVSQTVELIGSKIIREFYEDLTAFLKLVRKIRGDHQYNEKEELEELRKLIEKSTLNYISFLETRQPLEPDYDKMAKRLQRIQRLKKEDQKKAYYFVLDCLKEDPELLAEFNVRSSKPNYMAKEIVGKLLGVSSETITSVLYRKNRSKETNAV